MAIRCASASKLMSNSKQWLVFRDLIEKVELVLMVNFRAIIYMLELYWFVMQLFLRSSFMCIISYGNTVYMCP